MARPCTIKHLLVDHADPNEIAIEYIHASSMRLIAQFVHSPSAQGAHAIAVILDALAKHDENEKIPIDTEEGRANHS